MAKIETPLQITLYDPATNEVQKTYTRTFVPWKLLKQAVKLTKSLNINNMDDDTLDALAGLVVETFGSQFSIEDLNEGADASEMMAVLNNIIARAGGAVTANPPPPG